MFGNKDKESFLLLANPSEENTIHNIEINEPGSKPATKKRKKSKKSEKSLQNSDIDMINDNSNNSNKKSLPKNKNQISEEEKDQIRQKAEITITKTVFDICDDEVEKHNLENDNEDPMQISKEFKFGLSKFIFDTILVMGKDLEHFRKHRDKKTVIPQDAMLFFRRNKHIQGKMMEFQDSLPKSPKSSKKKKPT